MKNTVYITILELIGLLLINYLLPDEQTWHIVVKTFAGLSWISLSEVYRRRYEKKLQEKESE